MTTRQILSALGLTLGTTFVLVFIGLAVDIDPASLGILVALLSVLVAVVAVNWVKRGAARREG